MCHELVLLFGGHNLGLDVVCEAFLLNIIRGNTIYVISLFKYT